MKRIERGASKRGERGARGGSRRTIRVRLAALFFGVFVASGVVMLAVTVAVWQSRTGAVTASAMPVAAGSAANTATGITQHSSDRRQLLVAAGIGLTIMAALSLAVGWIVAGRFLLPLRTITMTARKISVTNLNERLHLDGPDDELKELADTFDELLDRLERSFMFERQFVANASHELRTPLAGMRASLDVAMAKAGPVPPQLDTLAGRLRRELDHVDLLLESFLTLAHSQQGPLGDRATVSLRVLAREAIARRAEEISVRGLSVEQEHGDAAWVSGSETLITRMVENLIDNSILHNKSGGWIRVTTEQADTRVRLIVENGGELLDANQVAHLTTPFRRIGAERTGSDTGAGLGLAIVSSIVEVHGGALELDALDGGGLRVATILPLAMSPTVEVPA